MRCQYLPQNPMLPHLLTVISTTVNKCGICFNIKTVWLLTTQCTYMLHVMLMLTVANVYFPQQRQQICDSVYCAVGTECPYVS
jgi:hypothetical protein